MNKIFGYDYRDIPYINRLKNRIFCGIVIIVLLLNLFVSLTLNFKKVADKSLFNPFIIVDLQHNLKEEEKNKIETDILSLKGVLSVRFMDKSESFALLQNDLNISIPESTNPLFDSMIVYLKDIDLAEKIQENLEGKEEIKQVYKENDFFERETERGLVFSIIQISSAIIAFLLAVISIIMFNLNTGIEFLNSVNISKDFQESIRISKIRNLLGFSSATIIGTLIFFNIYVLFRKFIFHNYFQYTMLSLWQIFILHIIVIAFLNFIVWILPANIFKIDGGEE
ncbi:permease-like cell division protein FtsX [Fusobacterium russii]|uniref:permease-like cell division protein FtsX n=1 Tax=Fusobacterium russii TaxID=854 RepID=UPI00039AEA8C|nr:permease-like cell division protein FtsX [Fusobacterium russii]